MFCRTTIKGGLFECPSGGFLLAFQDHYHHSEHSPILGECQNESRLSWFGVLNDQLLSLSISSS